MPFYRALHRCAGALYDFFWPNYQPERHYMRGPGPACMRKTGASEQIQF